ncbi:rho GTPase-activating protein SYDE1 isoform X2 [Betta splendens]|uniref:Rho GTPase-activating protein SYDE1 n=1 Tax=Betta splendens TaxID=158456 RepID=A0A6P7LB54_BETSP|nr:rho GTPase-activating protein SYDE1 isoform X2 [Betta splendens]
MAPDAPVKPNTIIQSSSSSSTSSMLMTTTTSPDPPFPSHNHITVAKKQQWARQGSVVSPCLAPASTPRMCDQEQLSIRSHHTAGRLTPNECQAEQCEDRTCTRLAWDLSSSPCTAVTMTKQQEGLQPAGGCPHVASTPGHTKLFGQRTYLQSLDRSSRAWVLSGKAQVSDEASGAQEESGSNIWYNPIPEEEDPGPCREEVIWRRRNDTEEEGVSKAAESEESRTEHQGLWIGSSEGGGPQEGTDPNLNSNIEKIGAENTDSSPTSQKKGARASSVMHRLRSPGTVRKLSLKMKKLPELRRKLSLRSSSRAHQQENESSTKTVAASSLSNQNVISRYHLDTSAAPARPLRQSSRGRSASKGGYLSDGDSPELLPRQQPHQPATSQEAASDFGSFRLYAGCDPPRCSQRVTGLLTVHLLGLEEMKVNRSEGSKEIFLVIQIDGATRARTALLTLRGSVLPLNHTFHLELERAQQLRIVVLTPGVTGFSVSAPSLSTAQGSKPEASGGPSRNRVCCLGELAIPPLFKGSRSQQLCVKLEPRGLLYVKLSLQEKWDTQPNSDSSAPSNVFGVELHLLVQKEGCAAPVPLLIQKCVAEIERRGLKMVGLYRLCGSAAVKKELRDWFERNSSAVCLHEDLYPDINVITGILKDYLRELPSPLITNTLYHVVMEAMILRPPPANPDPQLAQRTVVLLDCLPLPERTTLCILLDHLSLVASFSPSNRMTHQNLAVCFGPVLLTPTQDAWRGGAKGNEDITNAVDFKRHIEVLHYLLQLWPVPTHRVPTEDSIGVSSLPSTSVLPLNFQQQHRLPALCLAVDQDPEEEVVVSRRGRGSGARLESPPPINRYAGDWSICREDLVCGQEADYDEVAGSESDAGSDDEEEEEKKVWSSGGAGLYMDDFMDFEAPFNCRLSLKDFDTLIHDLDRELAKQINICL